MSTTIRSCGAVGPLPFKDVDGYGDAVPVTPTKEYDAIVSALPSNPKLWLRCYQGAWVMEPWVPGIITIQRSFRPRHGDVILASPPKCGTTWLKALAFSTMARGAYPPAGVNGGATLHPLLRLNPHDCVPFMEQLYADGSGSKMDALPSPRLMATHMQHSSLPASITTSPDCKIVYICRDLKDMLVSMWHFVASIRPDISFSEMFELAIEGRQLSGPIWDHILGYWNAGKARPETVLFLRYEDMLLDPANNVKKLAQFLGQPFSQAEEEAGVVAEVVKLCSFEKLRSLEVNKRASPAPAAVFSNRSYFRKGVSGDWADHMTPAMKQRLDAIIQDKFRGSGLAFA